MSESDTMREDHAVAACDADSINVDSDTAATTNCRARFEYEAQHFGFTPNTLLNGFYNTVCDMFREGLKAFCKTCLEKYPTIMREEELRTARQEVGRLIDNDIIKIFDSMEEYLLRTVFTIPDNVVLPEDKRQLEPQTEFDSQCNEGNSQMEQKSRELKEKIISVKYANALLQQHLEDSKQLQATATKVLEKLNSPGELSGSEMKDHLSYLSETLLAALKHSDTTTV